MKCRFKFKQLFKNYYEIDDNNTKYQMSNRQMMMVLEDFKKVLNTNKHKSNTQHKKLDLIQESILVSSSGSVKLLFLIKSYNYDLLIYNYKESEMNIFSNKLKLMDLQIYKWIYKIPFYAI